MTPPTGPPHSRLAVANPQDSLVLTSSGAGTISNMLTQPMREESPLSHGKRLLKGKTASRELSGITRLHKGICLCCSLLCQEQIFFLTLPKTSGKCKNLFALLLMSSSQVSGQPGSFGVLLCLFSEFLGLWGEISGVEILVV